jgi:hypothetical protein
LVLAFLRGCGVAGGRTVAIVLDHDISMAVDGDGGR